MCEWEDSLNLAIVFCHQKVGGMTENIPDDGLPLSPVKERRFWAALNKGVPALGTFNIGGG